IMSRRAGYGDLAVRAVEPEVVLENNMLGLHREQAHHAGIEIAPRHGHRTVHRSKVVHVAPVMRASEELLERTIVNGEVLASVLADDDVAGIALAYSSRAGDG